MGITGNWSTPPAGPIERLGRIGRRRFLATGALGAAALILGRGPYDDKVRAYPRLPDYPFGLGVASGDPEQDGVVLWTRLAPQPLAHGGKGGMPEVAVPVAWEVAHDESFRRVVRRGVTLARPELAHSVHVEVDGLRPDRWYFYRFRAAREISPTGRTKTAPSAWAHPSQMTLAFASCQALDGGAYTAYQHMAVEQLDLVVHLGDYIYENPGPAITLDEYRIRHAEHRIDPHLQATHAAFPWVVTWDDHEVDNDYANLVAHRSSPTRTPEEFLVRRANAYRAYYEHLPLRRSSVPNGPDMQLYRRLAYGRLAELNVLDTRQYRSDQAANADDPARTDPSRTITGEAQERWLLDGLARSRATWNVLAQQIFFCKWDFTSGPGVSYYMDGWDGYPASRDRIMSFIEQRGVANPVVLTGDVHSNWAGDLKANFDDPASATLGVELVGTSISSEGDGADVVPFDQEVIAENPHLKFANRQRGYVRCTVTPATWQADYRVVPYISKPDAPMYTRASFVTEAGNPGLVQIADTPVPSQPAATAQLFPEELEQAKELGR